MSCRRSVEPANTHIDRVDLPTAEFCDNIVADFLQSECTFHQVRVILGHLECVLIAEEIGGMEHEDV